MTSCSKLWPESTPGNSTDHWGWLAGKLGAVAPLTRPFLIGIRGAAPLAPETHETIARPAYDDSFVLLEADGKLPPYLFAGATHAYQLDSGLSPDVDGDKRGDVGTILPGRYLLTLAADKPYPIFVLTTPDGSGNIPAVRDTNHDGRYSPEEYARQSVATAVLLHSGWDAPADSAHRSSIACQTCNVSNLRLLAVETKRAGRKTMDYVLITADDALAILADSPFRSRAIDPSEEPTTKVNMTGAANS